MSRKGNCLDNARMESFFGTLKSEMCYRERFGSVADLQTAIDECIHYYNHDRIKMKLGGLSPVAYRTQAAVAWSNHVQQTERTPSCRSKLACEGHITLIDGDRAIRKQACEQRRRSLRLQNQHPQRRQVQVQRQRLAVAWDLLGADRPGVAEVGAGV